MLLDLTLRDSIRYLDLFEIAFDNAICRQGENCDE
jgi:hypothetical protein